MDYKNLCMIDFNYNLPYYLLRNDNVQDSGCIIVAAAVAAAAAAAGVVVVVFCSVLFTVLNALKE